MKRILIEHFQSLDNYGTGMMGLVTVQALADRYGTAEVEFHCDFADAATLEAVRRELRGDVRLYRHDATSCATKWMFLFYHELICSATLRSAQILNISAH